MDASPQTQQMLLITSFVVLVLLAIYQYTHYVIAAWRYRGTAINRPLLVGLVAVGWIAYGAFFLSVVPAIGSYTEAIPLVLAGLYTPTVLALVGFVVSKRFRAFVDTLSLRWLIASVEGPARIIVGVIFLFWYFAGALPAVVAWVAGPGDILAGLFAIYALRYLEPLAEAADVQEKHWSILDFLRRLPVDVDPAQFQRQIGIVVGLVLFGILDFIAAPASTAVSIALGEVPEAMGMLPLAFIPLLLVPQVLVLEVLAMRQFYAYWKRIRASQGESDLGIALNGVR